MSREYWVSGLMALTAMLTLVGYEFMRSSSTVLFKTAYGAENLPLLMAALPFVVFGTVWVYGRILTLMGPRRTLVVTSLGSGGLIIACYFIVLTGADWITPVLFLIKEVYIVLLIEQYWSYINSSVSPTTSRRVNGPITGVAGLGSVLGAFLLSETAPVYGTEMMVLFGALMLIPSAVLANVTYTIHGEPDIPPEEKSVKNHMGWRWLKENPTLLYLLLIVLSTQVVSAVLDFKWQELLSLAFEGRPDDETAYQGRAWALINGSSTLIQFVVAPILLSIISLRLIHILMPLIHITAITVAIIEPTILTVGIAFGLFKAFDYSLFRAAKEVLYVPLSFGERYRAKEIVDVFGYRSGKGATAVVITALQRLGASMGSYYLGIAFVAVGVWLVLIFPLTRRASEAERERAAEVTT